MTISRNLSVAVACLAATLTLSACQGKTVYVAGPTNTVTLSPTPTQNTSPTQSASPPPTKPDSALLFCVMKGSTYDTYAIASQPTALAFFVRQSGDGQGATQVQTPNWRHWTIIPDGTTDPNLSTILIEGRSAWYSPQGYFGLDGAIDEQSYRDFFGGLTNLWAAAIGHSPLCPAGATSGSASNSNSTGTDPNLFPGLLYPAPQDQVPEA